MSDLVELQVPQSITLASETITKENVDQLHAARLRILTGGESSPATATAGQTSEPDATVGVGMVGYAFMGRAHSQAWRSVGRVLRPAAATPVDGRVWPARSAERVAAAAARLGWAAVETDWRELLRRDDVQIIDICTPGRQPRRDRDRRARRGQARAVREAARQHRRRGRGDDRRRGPRPGTRRPAMVGFNYRRVPAVALARRLVADGRIGDRSGTSAPSTCRTGSSTRSSRWSGGCDREKAGSGALGDIGAHIVDTAQFITGQQLAGVTALDRDVREGAPAAPRRGRPRRRGRHGRGPVTVDDAALFIGRHRRRRRRHLRGHPLRHRPQERAADRGQRLARRLAFDLEATERTVVLRRRRGRPTTAGFRRILVTEPDHPYLAPGGRPATSSATSTPSPTRWRDFAHGDRGGHATRAPPSPTGCRSSGCSPPSRDSAAVPALGRRSTRRN